MHTPLLREENKRFPFSNCNLSILTILSTLIVFSLFSFLHESQQTQPEVRVGAPPNWDPLVENFFALEAFTTKENATPYEFKEDPETGASYCDLDPQTMACDLACKHILIDEVPSRYCYKASDPFDKCWNTQKMRCWDVDGGVKIWDGIREFLVVKHWKLVALGYGKSMRCLHVRQEEEDKDVILFGWGFVRPVQQICNLLAGRADFLGSLWKIPPENTVLIGGHSEGSGWAMCLNEWAQKHGIPNTRHVVTSGTLVPDAAFIQAMDTYSVENSLFLMHARNVEDGVLPDVFPILHALEGRTFPYFGYICNNEGPTCSGLMTPDLAKSFEETAKRKRAGNAPKEVSQIAKDIHMFSAYRRCWRACRAEFPRIYGTDRVFNYQWNVPSFDVLEYPLPEPLIPISPPQDSPEMMRPMLRVSADFPGGPRLWQGDLVPPSARPIRHVSPPSISQAGPSAGTMVQPPDPPGWRGGSGMLPKIPPSASQRAPTAVLQRPPGVAVQSRRTGPPPRPFASPRLAAPRQRPFASPPNRPTPPRPPEGGSSALPAADIERKGKSRSRSKKKKKGGSQAQVVTPRSEAGPSQVSPPSVSGLSISDLPLPPIPSSHSDQIRDFAQTKPHSPTAVEESGPFTFGPDPIHQLLSPEASPFEPPAQPPQQSQLSPEAEPFRPPQQSVLSPEAQPFEPASPGSTSGLTLSDAERQKRKELRQTKGVPKAFLPD